MEGQGAFEWIFGIFGFGSPIGHFSCSFPCVSFVVCRSWRKRGWSSAESWPSALSPTEQPRQLYLKKTHQCQSLFPFFQRPRAIAKCSFSSYSYSLLNHSYATGWTSFQKLRQLPIYQAQGKCLESICCRIGLAQC